MEPGGSTGQGPSGGRTNGGPGADVRPIGRQVPYDVLQASHRIRFEDLIPPRLFDLVVGRPEDLHMKPSCRLWLGHA